MADKKFILEGRVDDFDGNSTREFQGKVMMDAFEPPANFMAYNALPRPRPPLRSCGITIPTFMAGELPEFKGGSRVRITVEVID
jgi:hypothetical protein